MRVRRCMDVGTGSGLGDEPRRRRGIAPARDGFTLIEVLVTLVILSTGIVVILRAFETSLVALSAARDSLRATWVAGDVMSELEASVAERNRVETPGGLRVGAALADYRWQVGETDRPGPAAGGRAGGVLREIVVTVSSPGSKRAHTTATCIFTRNDGDDGRTGP